MNRRKPLITIGGGGALGGGILFGGTLYGSSDLHIEPTDGGSVIRQDGERIDSLSILLPQLRTTTHPSESECMSTLSDIGMVAGAEGLYTVVSESGRSYTVDIETGTCECDDAFYRQPTGGCKHVRRVRFATGRRSIPEWVNDEAVDDQLGLHVETDGKAE